MIRVFSFSLLAAVLPVSYLSTQVTSAASQSTNQQVFRVKGLVLAIKPREKEIQIKHEAIPGYMPAMIMPFSVKSTNELAGLEPGDQISFRLLVNETEGWIDQIRKLASHPTNGPSTTSSVRLAREVEPLQVGDPLPPYHFINQFGTPFDTGQFKGKALAINFLFTRCPYPSFCPRMARDFMEAQQKLQALANGPTNWHLLTISFDPQFDTPETLKAYAQTYKYDPQHWTLATGDLLDITAIGEQLGLVFWHDESGSISHNLRTAIVDASGRLQRVFIGNDWTSDELVNELVKAARRPAPR